MFKFIMIISILLVAESFSEEIAFITPDVANIRISPDVKSDLIARFLINTKVNIKAKKDEWRKIYVNNIEGWVHHSLLRKNVFTLSELVDSLKKADSPKDKKNWADRLITGFPYNSENYKLILNTYMNLNDSAGITVIQNLQNNSEEIYIARAQFRQIQLLGKINSKGDFETSVRSFFVNRNDGEMSDNGITYGKNKNKKFIKELTSLGWALTSRRWYSFSGEVLSVNFPQFHISPFDGEFKDINNPGAYESLWLYNSRWINFGNHSQETFFATAPIKVIKTGKGERFNQFDIARKNVCQDDGYFSTVYSGSNKLSISINPLGIFNLFEVITTCAMCTHDASWDEPFTGIVDIKGNRLYPSTRNTLVLQKKDSQEEFNDWQFFKIINRPQVLSILRYQTADVEYHVQLEDFLIINGENDVKGFNIVTCYNGH